MDKSRFINIVKPYTMTTEERVSSLFESLEYIRKNEIDGDIVECGVWKGGNILGCIEYMKHHGMNKKVWLYDTFTGMPPVGVHDVDLYGNSGKNWEGKCNASLQEVKSIISTSGYPTENITYVVGDVSKTLLVSENVPNKISLLRLDTDWYESTKTELEILYPSLEKNGVLIIDDYGHWKGSKLATDEYFQNRNLKPEFKQIDYTGVLMLKTE